MEFLLGSVINAVVSQVMILLRERNLQLIRDIPEEIKSLAVCGDQVRIQQVLADFLLNMVRYAPSPDGWVEIHVRPSLKQISDEITHLHTEFRYVGLAFFLHFFQLYVDGLILIIKKEQCKLSYSLPFFFFIFLFKS